MPLEMIWSFHDLIMKSWLSWESAWRMPDTILCCLFYCPFKLSHYISAKERKILVDTEISDVTIFEWLCLYVFCFKENTLYYLYGRQSISGSPSSSSSLHECPFIGIFKKETLKKFGLEEEKWKRNWTILFLTKNLLSKWTKMKETVLFFSIYYSLHENKNNCYTIYNKKSLLVFHTI